MDIFIAAEHALTDAERQAFLDSFPAQRGAHVADILDMLNNGDADLDIVEPICEEHRYEVTEPLLLRVATYLALGIKHAAPEVTWEDVRPYVERIRASAAGGNLSIE